MQTRQKLMKIHSKWLHSWRCVTSATNRAALRGGLFCMPACFNISTTPSPYFYPTTGRRKSPYIPLRSHRSPSERFQPFAHSLIYPCTPRSHSERFLPVHAGRRRTQPPPPIDRYTYPPTNNAIPFDVPSIVAPFGMFIVFNNCLPHVISSI